MRTNVFYYLFLLLGSMGFSQNGEITNHIYEGNKKTETEAYTEAEKEYRRALSLAPEKAEALYNLGNTHFLDEQYEEASQRFFQTQKFASNKDTPQLLANGCIPFSGEILVPSGNRITEKPFLSFKTPLLITFLRLLNLLALFKVIGFIHLKAQPKKGIYISSFFTILVDGIKRVCK